MATRHRGRDWTDLSALIVRPLRQARCQTSRTSNQSLRRGASRVLCPTPRHLARACSFPRQKRKGTPTAHRAYGDRNHRKRGSSMRISSLVLALLLVTGAPGALAAQPELKTEEQKTLYALGLLVAQNLSSFALSPADLEIVKAGLTDGVANKEKKVDLQTYGPKIQEFQRARVTAAAVPERKAGQAFADKAAAEKGAVKTPSGAVITTLKPGTGASPTAADKVKVHYHGTLTHGTVFDSSVQRGEPITFPLSGVIKCWTEGVQQMKVGGKSRLVCPADTAYGDRGTDEPALATRSEEHTSELQSQSNIVCR